MNLGFNLSVSIHDNRFRQGLHRVTLFQMMSLQLMNTVTKVYE